jgi:hypothetical protein
MTQEDEKRLKAAIEDILWMAARYAHGRQTYASSIVRESVKTFLDIYPDFNIKQDCVIAPPREEDIQGLSFRSDYLDDIFNNQKQ